MAGYFFSAPLEGSQVMPLNEYINQYTAGNATYPDGVVYKRSKLNLLPDGTLAPENIPPLLPRDWNRSYLKPIVNEGLAIKEKAALARYRDWFPRLPDENIRDDYATILSDDWQGYSRGTVVYVRTTNFGKMAFGIVGTCIDQETGILENKELDQLLEESKPAAENEVSEVSFQVIPHKKGSANKYIDAAMTLASYIAFALPGGAIISGIIIFFKMLLGLNKGPSLADTIEKAVGTSIAKDDLNTAYAVFLTDYTWFNAKLGVDPPETEDEQAKQDYEDFKSQLKEKLADDKGLLTQINVIKGELEQIIGFPLFLTMASFALMLMKVQLYIISLEAKGELRANDTSRLLKAYFKQYITYAENTVGAIDKKVKDRLKMVSSCQHKDAVSAGMRGNQAFETHHRYSYFTDEYLETEKARDDKNPNSTIQKDIDKISKLYDLTHQLDDQPIYKKNSKSVEKWQPQTKAINRNREKYIELLKIHTEFHYYKDKRENIIKVIESWKKSADTYNEIYGG